MSDRSTRRRRLLAATIGLTWLPALAWSAEPCTGVKPTLPPPLASWTNPVALKAASTKDGLPGAQLRIGQAARLELAATSAIAFVVQPREPGGNVSSGGMASFNIVRAGTYRVAIGNRAWLDVVKGDALADSVAHQHGPACSGIGKMVDFTLAPGDYVLQISGSGKPVLEVLVTSTS